jgi:hypothetical protein
MVQAVEKASRRGRRHLGPRQISSPMPGSPTESAITHDGRELPWLPREGQEAAAWGMTPASARRGQEALQVLPGCDQQALDIDVLKPASPEVT